MRKITATLSGGYVRWIVCALLFAAIAINYVDRQVLSILKPTLQHQYDWTETGYANVVFWFQATYGVSYLLFGRFVDRFGAKAGMIAAGALWTVGHMAHALVTSTRGFSIVRIPLAMGEAGAFPAAIAAVSEWFPQKERALAIGIFNAGTNIGAIVAPLIVPAITLMYGWKMAFIVTGLLTIVWLVTWILFYRKPREHRSIGTSELEYIEAGRLPEQPKVSWRILLGQRETWAYICGRFLIDPIWYTFLFWLPDFLGKAYDVDLKNYGPPLVAVYLLADIGSVAGGWTSSRLLKRGATVNRARKQAMLFCALAVVPVVFAINAPNMWVAVGLIGLACAGHQGFSANLFSLPGDLFPRGAAITVVGLGGLGGAVGGMLMAQYAGWILDKLGSYMPIFAIAAVAYLIALAVIHLLTPRYAPVALNRLAGETG